MPDPSDLNAFIMPSGTSTFPSPQTVPRNRAQGWAMALLHIRLDTIIHLQQIIERNSVYQSRLELRLLSLRRFSNDSVEAQTIINGVHNRYLSMCRRQLTLTLCLDNVIKRNQESVARDLPLFHVTATL